jgi:hypothetical protein
MSSPNANPSANAHIAPNSNANLPPPPPLIVQSNKYIPSVPTSELLDEIGGTQALIRMTTIFYDMVFKNSHLDKFFQKPEEPHAERLATWVSEKMAGMGVVGDGSLLPAPREFGIVALGETAQTGDNPAAGARSSGSTSNSIANTVESNDSNSSDAVNTVNNTVNNNSTPSVAAASAAPAAAQMIQTVSQQDNAPQKPNPVSGKTVYVRKVF